MRCSVLRDRGDAHRRQFQHQRRRVVPQRTSCVSRPFMSPLSTRKTSWMSVHWHWVHPVRMRDLAPWVCKNHHGSLPNGLTALGKVVPSLVVVHDCAFNSQGFKGAISCGEAETKVTVWARTVISREIRARPNTNGPRIFSVDFARGKMLFLHFNRIVRATVMVMVSYTWSVDKHAVVWTIAIPRCDGNVTNTWSIGANADAVPHSGSARSNNGTRSKNRSMGSRCTTLSLGLGSCNCKRSRSDTGLHIYGGCAARPVARLRSHNGSCRCANATCLRLCAVCGGTNRRLAANRTIHSR